MIATSCWKQSKPEDSGATYYVPKGKKHCQTRILYMEKLGNTKAEKSYHLQKQTRRSFKRSHGDRRKMILEEKLDLHKGMISTRNDVYVNIRFLFLFLKKS